MRTREACVRVGWLVRHAPLPRVSRATLCSVAHTQMTRARRRPLRVDPLFFYMQNAGDDAEIMNEH